MPELRRETRGSVTDIQRFSVHDGPGIRTTVFLKGCNLRCFWCHNPETWRPEPELQVLPERCIGCGACIEVCERGAHEATPEGKVFHRGLCRACGACARGCYAGGLSLVGREMTADEVVAEVAQDIAFYGDDGGITLSGGEPLCQREFSAAILERCKASGLRAAIETNLACEWAHFAPLIPLLDLVMLDLKAFDPELHRRGTGATNVRILDNARRLAGTGLDLIARTPVIPGYNDDPDEIASIARYIAPLPGVLYYELLPYHPLGVSKHASLGLDDPTEIPAPPNAECIDRLAEAARAAGVAVRVAGRGPHSTSSANPDSQIYAYTCLLYQEVLM